jgi:hypothetical protein
MNSYTFLVKKTAPVAAGRMVPPVGTSQHRCEDSYERLMGANMEVEKSKVRTFDEDERAEMDRANDRVEAEMKLLESEAKQQVAQGLQDSKIADEAQDLRREAEREIHKVEENEERQSKS